MLKKRGIPMSRHLTSSQSRGSGASAFSRAAIVAFAALVALVGVALQPASAAGGARRAVSREPGAGVDRIVASLPQWGYLATLDRANSAPGITSVSCPNQHFCAAVDGSGDAMVFEGRTWSKPVTVDPDPYGLTSVSCVSVKFCVAVDADGFALVWSGKHWGPPRSIDPIWAAELNPAVSCTSIYFCAVVDARGTGVIWNGKKWSATTIPFAGAPTAVSCTSSTFCLAGDNTGDVYTWNGKKWSSPRAVDSGGWVNAVSCSKGPFCVADGAHVETFNGSKWSPPEPISAAALRSAACVSSRFCLAGDGLGDIYVWRSGRWSQQATIDPDNSINGALLSDDHVLCGRQRERTRFVLRPGSADHNLEAAGGQEVALVLGKADGRGRARLARHLAARLRPSAGWAFPVVQRRDHR
jgi:hypothetical protein